MENQHPIADENSSDALYQGPASLAPYPLHLGSPVIKAVDKGKIRTAAVETMHKNAEAQMQMLRKQADLLLKQAEDIEKRIRLSERIYMANMGFEPICGPMYHLYQHTENEIISLIGPMEWGVKGCPYDHWIATVRLLGDKTWEILMENTMEGGH
jgi:hypothetical protein